MLQESTSSGSEVLKNKRLPLFVVDIAYAEGVEELAASSKNVCADPSELVVFHPSETEFHTRLEVCSSMSTCPRRNSLGLPGTINHFAKLEVRMYLFVILRMSTRFMTENLAVVSSKHAYCPAESGGGRHSYLLRLCCSMG